MASNQNQTNVKVVDVPLQTVATGRVFIAAPGTSVFSLLFFVPAGVQAWMILGQQLAIPLDEGPSSYDMTTDCQPFDAGIGIQTDVTYPAGTVARIVLGGGVRTA